MAGRHIFAANESIFVTHSAIDSPALGGLKTGCVLGINGPPNRCLRAENRPVSTSVESEIARAASPRTHPDLEFPARADLANETCVLVALLKPKLCLVRMNPFILCPGQNGSSAAQIELREQSLELARRAMRCLSDELLARMAADGAGSPPRTERCIFGALSRAPGER